MARSEARARLGLRPDAFYLLLGAQNFEEIRKGAAAAQDLLQRLGALPAVQAKVRSGSVRVACFGTASDKLKLAGWQVDRLGYLADESALRAAYSSCDLLLFTSQEDNLPNVILEAMACGLPAAGFSVGGVPDLIEDGETGLLLNPGDPAGNAARIADIIEQPERRAAWSTRARQKVVEAFTLDHQSAAMIDLYRKVVASARRGEVPVLDPATEDTFLDFDAVVQLAAADARHKIKSAEGGVERLQRFLKACRRAPWKLYGKRPSLRGA
jgi:glycosyltransferase involved in cell wall biosynthesis